MLFDFLAITEQGSYHESNQDRFYANTISSGPGTAFLGVVCDGMGGLSHGEVASTTVISCFSDWFENEFPTMVRSDSFCDDLAARWQEIIADANNMLRTGAGQSEGNMGTTVSALLLLDGRFYIAQIGDSRVYMGGKDFFAAVTKDHSYVMEQVEKGLMTCEEARLSRKKNVLTRCVGVMENVSADLYTGVVMPGDFFLICSDGFCSSLTSQEVYKISGCSSGMPPKSKEILEAAVSQKRLLGEKDDITAVTVFVSENDSEPATIQGKEICGGQYPQQQITDSSIAHFQPVDRDRLMKHIAPDVQVQAEEKSDAVVSKRSIIILAVTLVALLIVAVVAILSVIGRKTVTEVERTSVVSDYYHVETIVEADNV